MKRIVDLSTQDIYAGAGAARIGVVSLVVGLAALAASFYFGFAGGVGQQRFYFSYLHAFCFFMSLALGGLWFTFIQHLVSAGWSVVVRRFAEILMINVVPMAVLAIPLILGREQVWTWLNPDVAAQDALVAKKAGYLNQSFFLTRLGVYFALWILLGIFFYRGSVSQDANGDFRTSMRMKRVAAPTAVLFALSISFFAFDVLMSLDPHWFSTIFGVYYFAGSVVTTFAALVIICHLAQRAGKVRDVISRDHYHDLGKLTFAFTVFWAYIAFSQFMLIWYANIPEETSWYLRRIVGEWRDVSWFLLWGHFVVPFVALISRYPKRRPALLVFPAIWVLFVHWIDVYWLIMPELPGAAEGVIPWSITDLTCWLGVGGVFVAAAMFRARSAALIPKEDPRLNESLAFENVGG